MSRKPTRVEARDYLRMSADKPGDTAQERRCFEAIYADMPPLVSLLELFGGSGLMASVLKASGTLSPLTYHEAWDQSIDCVHHFQTLHRLAIVRQVDSFTREIPPRPPPDTAHVGFGWDLLSADFNSWTFLKFRRDKVYAALTERIFASGARRIQLTDASPGWLHLNVAHYERAGLTQADRVDSYLYSLMEYFQARFGYGLTEAATHARASYLLFEPTTIKTRFNWTDFRPRKAWAMRDRGQVYAEPRLI